MIAFFATLVGALVGAGASIATTVLTNREEMRRQRTLDKSKRRERARAFQRSTLLETQEALQEFMRRLGQVRNEDVIAYQNTGEWGTNRLPTDLDQALLNANHQLIALTERIANDDLRSDLASLRTKGLAITLAESPDESRSRLDATIDDFPSLMESLGTELRSAY